MQVVPNALESQRFGVNFGRLENVSDSPDELRATLGKADEQGIDVISVRVATEDLALVRTLEDAGFRLMDTLVYYRIGLPMEPFASKGPTIVPLEPGDADAAADMARRSFHGYMGHYHADPRLSDAAADEAYADWTWRLISEPAPGQIMVGVKDAGEILGYMVGRPIGPKSSDMLLSAVSSAAQRGGIYTGLVRAYLAVAMERGDDEAVISTQIQNYAVQKAWSRTGMTLYSSYQTLHRWSSPA